MKFRIYFGVGLLFVAIVLTVLLWPREVPDSDRVSENHAHLNAAIGAEVHAPSVAGVVADADERPVDGATVSVGGVTATTDVAGRFLVRDVATGDVVITASADGYIVNGPLAARVEAHIEEGSSLDDVRLTLRGFGSISGSVEAAGKPVAARLSVLYAGEAFAIDGIGTSSADGTFTVTSVPPGRVRILVETDTYAVTESREIDLGDGEQVQGIEIDLAAAGELAGKVIDTDGKPVEGAEVYAIAPSAPRPKLARTTRTGGFRFGNFAVGDARVRVVASGFTEGIVEDVAVERGEVALVEVVLEKASGVNGRVVDASGPVSGAFIVGDERPRVVRSGEDGTFAIERAIPESIVAVSPRHASSAPATPTGAPVELTLGPGGTIEGRVVDASGAAVQEFEVGVEAFEVDGPAPYHPREIGVKQVLSSDGSFALGPLRPGRYWLRASARGQAPGSSSVVQVNGGKETRGVRIALTSGGSVTGIVTNGSGQPVERATVQLFDPLSPFRSAAARTDAEGRFVVRGVSPGRRSLRVGKRGYLTAVSSGIEVPSGGEATRNVVLGAAAPGEKFQFHGIGAVLKKDGDAIEIMNTMEGKPAATFGLSKGDRILAVDGEATTDMRLDNVVELIRGEEGAAVELEVEREGEGRFTVKVERGRVVVR